MAFLPVFLDKNKKSITVYKQNECYLMAYSLIVQLTKN